MDLSPVPCQHIHSCEVLCCSAEPLALPVGCCNAEQANNPNLCGFNNPNSCGSYKQSDIYDGRRSARAPIRISLAVAAPREASQVLQTNTRGQALLSQQIRAAVRMPPRGRERTLRGTDTPRRAYKLHGARRPCARRPASPNAPACRTTRMRWPTSTSSRSSPSSRPPSCTASRTPRASWTPCLA